MPNMLLCKKCNQTLPEDSFYKHRDSKTGRASTCKQCYSAQSLDHYATKKKIYNEKQKLYRENNKAKLKERRLKRNFNLTVEQYEGMLYTQNNSCYICNIPFNDKQKPNVDHCHEDGHVRKLLCQPCNTTLGLVKESISTLTNMIEYLKEHDATFQKT